MGPDKFTNGNKEFSQAVNLAGQCQAEAGVEGVGGLGGAVQTAALQDWLAF